MVDEFLDLYKVLEDLLEEKYNGHSGSYPSVVVRFINEKEAKPFKESLNTCREIRNVLTHNPYINGEPVIEPSNAVYEELKKAVNYLKAPPTASKLAISREKIITADLNENVMKLMGRMKMKGYSHIPVIHKKRFFGIFSVSTIFSCIMERVSIDENTVLGDIRDFLLIENHVSETFDFVKPTTSLSELKDMFNRKKNRYTKRLAGVFITHSGLSDDELLGMITPYDIL